MSVDNLDIAARLARLALAIEHRRALCAELHRVTEKLAQTNLLSDDDHNLCDRLRRRLDNVRAALAGIDGQATAAAFIDDLESAVADGEWQRAERRLRELQNSERRMQQLLQSYAARLAATRPLLGRVHALLDEAERVRAPVRSQRAEYVRVAALADRAARELADGRLGFLQATLDELEAEQETLHSLVAEVDAAVAATAPLARQADLLLVRSERARRAYRFTLVLRTAGSAGAHGVNIQDTSTISEEDHRRLRLAVRQIGALINDGLARAFAAAGSCDAMAGSSDVNALAEHAGSLLYDLLLPRDLQRYLRETPCSITLTTNDLELPWELLCDVQLPNKFLCLERPVARMPMGRAYPHPVEQERRRAAAVRFLLIHADPTGDLPAARREVEHIADTLRQRWGDAVQVHILERASADGDHLNAVLRSADYDVIHYAGHARFDIAQPDQSALVLHRGEELTAEKISRLLKGRPLVFLNACETGKTANEKKPQAVGRFLQRPAEGLATAFIYAGALAYVGSLWPIYDDAAAAFAASFYSDLVEGYTLGEAMRRARLHSRTAYARQITWASYVLFGDPTARLVAGERMTESADV